MMTAYLNYWIRLDPREYVNHALIYLALAALLGILGPFGTYGEPHVWRLSYWLTMLCIFGGVVVPFSAMLLTRIDAVHRTRLIPGGAMLVLAAALPMTLIVGVIDVALSALASRLSAAGLMDPQPVAEWRSAGSAWWDFAAAAVLYVQVAAISLVAIGLVSLRFAVRQGSTASPHLHPQYQLPLSARPGAAFLSRIPDAIGTDLICLRMEDHYVRAVTRQGEALILLRMRDAIAELDGVPGLQVHRSWWVAADAIVKLSRDGRRTEVLLSNGLRAPVSASFRPVLHGVLASAA